jgi:alpha-L-rhamnosidase
MESPYSNWIWTPDWNESCEADPAFVCFRKTFYRDKEKENLRVRISADSRYKLYVNGKFVHSGPRKGDEQVWYYDTLDLTRWLIPGQNVLAAEVLRYPRTFRKGNCSICRTEYPGFYLKALDRDDISADGTWKVRINRHIRIVSKNPVFSPLKIQEDAEGSKEFYRWMMPDYDDRDWSHPSVYTYFRTMDENGVMTGSSEYMPMYMPRTISPGNLMPRPIPLMRNTFGRFTQVVKIRAGSAAGSDWERMLAGERSVTIPPESHQIVEIGVDELKTAYLKLETAGGEGSRINILTSECYAYPPKPGETLPVKGDRTDSEHGTLYGITDRYLVSGCGRPGQPERYEPYWFRTFRYVQLDIRTGQKALTLMNFDFIESVYPLEVRAEIETSDPVINAVWKLSVHTLQLCMHETYEDCPFYEQLQYAMDSRAQILYTYSVSGDDRLARACIDDFHRSVRYDGLINCRHPSCGPKVIPGFSIYYILMIYDHMMYFADQDLVRRYLPTVEGILDFFRRNRNEQGLVGKIGGRNGKERYWSFIDWTAQWNSTNGVPRATLSGPLTMESLLYAYGLQHAACLMKFVNRTEDAERYQRQADEILDSVNRYCVGKNGLYQDGPGLEEYSQHCQVFAVLTGCAGGQRAKDILHEVMREGAPYPKCSVAMAFYVFRAMEKAGLYNETAPLWDPWRRMVKNHLTTLVEDEVNCRSDCHAWGAQILYEIPAVILGMRPEKPGFADFRPSPTAGPFAWVRGQVPTPMGMKEAETGQAGQAEGRK